MLIDSHCHLDKYSKRGELDEILNEASLAGVNRMITVGTSSEDWENYRQLAKDFPGQIDYTIGLHPCHVDERWEKELEELERMLNEGGSQEPVAVGEMGLDYWHLPKDEEAREAQKDLQMQAFRAQLKLAKNTSLPIVIHSREAFDDCVKTLDSEQVVWDRVVFHCFSGGKDHMDRINLRGGRGSFTGIVTYDNRSADPVRESMLEQGVERLMIETDAPYLTPVPRRGEENRPAYLRYTFQRIAGVLQMPVLELEAQLEENTKNFFNLD